MPKLITDARWSAVGSLKERRLIFDNFCKSCAADHKRGKADGVHAARDGFAALLDEAAVQSARPLPLSCYWEIFRSDITDNLLLDGWIAGWVGVGVTRGYP